MAFLVKESLNLTTNMMLIVQMSIQMSEKLTGPIRGIGQLTIRYRRKL